MTDKHEHGCDVSCLPGTIPIFPLTGALLLPRGRLPLNIFEPRYIAMVDDALGPHTATGRMIGMIQPRSEGSKDLHAVGCAGRIVAFGETDDGRYLITLEGVCRFKIGEELQTTRGYRRIVPLWDSYKDDIDYEEATTPRFNRTQLVNTLRPYFKAHDIVANWDTIGELSAEKLVAAIAAACPFTPTEKQAVLEARSLCERYEVIIALLKMPSKPSDGARH